MIAPEIAPLIGVSSQALRAIAVLILTALVALIVAGRGNRALQLGRFSLRFPDSRTASRQFLVTVLDIAASASVLYVLLPDGVIGWPAFLAIYAVAIGLGVLSHVPAGLGVFETVIVAALGQAADVDTILGALVLYRLIYHVLPLLLAVIFVVGAELRSLYHKPVASSLRRVGGRLTPLLLATLALILASMLVFSSVTPTPDDNLAFLADYVPLPVIEGAHFLASLLGLVLVIIARGLPGGWTVPGGRRSLLPSWRCCSRCSRPLPWSKQAFWHFHRQPACLASHVRPAGQPDERATDHTLADGDGGALRVRGHCPVVRLSRRGIQQCALVAV